MQITYRYCVCYLMVGLSDPFKLTWEDVELLTEEEARKEAGQRIDQEWNYPPGIRIVTVTVSKVTVEETEFKNAVWYRQSGGSWYAYNGSQCIWNAYSEKELLQDLRQKFGIIDTQHVQLRILHAR